jgi:hypothetical protein
LRTWEQDENTLGTREKTKKPLSPCPLKKEKKNWTIHEFLARLIKQKVQ